MDAVVSVGHENNMEKNSCAHYHSIILTSKYQRIEKGPVVWVIREFCKDCDFTLKVEEKTYGD